jgi:predicted acyltransferase
VLDAPAVLLDHRRRRLSEVVFVFVVIGMNALAVYLCNTFTRLPQVVEIFTKAPAAAMGSFGPLSAALAFFAVEWSILYWMYKRKLFLSA